MTEALVAAAGTGFLLGLRYRIPAAIIASAVAAAAGAIVAYLTGASLWGVLVAPLAAVAALQCGYIGGVLTAVGVSRAGQSDRRRDWNGGERAASWDLDDAPDASGAGEGSGEQ